MSEHRYRWRGIDDPSREESAVVRFEGDSMRAHGSSIAAGHATTWRLRIGAGWITEELEVTSVGDDWSRALRLRRDPNGCWSTATGSHGDADLPRPGLDDPDVLHGALDCDLGLCPVTNVMPIRRLGLLTRSVEPVPLVMAWVEVPSLRVIRSDQRYGSRTPVVDGLGSVRYESRSRAFDAELVVDGNGMVIEYPTLAGRVSP